MMTKRTSFVVTATTTRAQVQQEIADLRHLQRVSVIPSTAREYADQADALLDEWLTWAPEPA